jgi:hypothetical protein
MTRIMPNPHPLTETQLNKLSTQRLLTILKMVRTWVRNASEEEYPAMQAYFEQVKKILDGREHVA